VIAVLFTLFAVGREGASGPVSFLWRSFCGVEGTPAGVGE
jgi:hypothetical protein